MTDSLWEDLVRLVRIYAAQKYGSEAEGFAIQLRGGIQHYEPFPPAGLTLRRPEVREGAGLAGWAAGPEPRHLSDFQAVYWPGLGRFSFSPKQALVVARLWQAWEEGLPGVSQAELLRAADSDSGRLLDLFRNARGQHPAWGTLILRAEGLPLTYTLPALSSEDPSPGSPGIS